MTLPDVPGLPDFYTHAAKPDPTPGPPPGFPVPPERRRLAVVHSTHAALCRFNAELDDLAARAEAHLRARETRRMEGRELATVLEVTVQRLDLCLRGHARVSKEYARTGLVEVCQGRRNQVKAVFYFLA